MTTNNGLPPMPEPAPTLKVVFELSFPLLSDFKRFSTGKIALQMSEAAIHDGESKELLGSCVTDIGGIWSIRVGNDAAYGVPMIELFAALAAAHKAGGAVTEGQDG